MPLLLRREPQVVVPRVGDQWDATLRAAARVEDLDGIPGVAPSRSALGRGGGASGQCASDNRVHSVVNRDRDHGVGAFSFQNLADHERGGVFPPMVVGYPLDAVFLDVRHDDQFGARHDGIEAVPRSHPRVGEPRRDEEQRERRGEDGSSCSALWTSNAHDRPPFREAVASPCGRTLAPPGGRVNVRRGLRTVPRAANLSSSTMRPTLGTFRPRFVQGLELFGSGASQPWTNPKSSPEDASAICSHRFHFLPTGADRAAPSNGIFSNVSIMSFGGRRSVAAAFTGRAVLAGRQPEGLREDQGQIVGHCGAARTR